MELKEFIDIVCPEHARTSCSDNDISNGFYLEEDDETVSEKYMYRCTRCALLEIENGTIKMNEKNSKIISKIMLF